MAFLVLVRHGQSVWNAKGLWTGLTDIPLSDDGKIESRKIAEQLKDVKIDIAFTSELLRAKETLKEIKQVLRNESLQVIEDKALNERDYGQLTGKNKWEIKKDRGEEEFQKIRRFWDYPIPAGETLKQVYNRVVPYYKEYISPYLTLGKNVLVVAHGNSLRALVKYLEEMSDEDVVGLEIGTGEMYLYEIDTSGKVTASEIRCLNTNKAHV